MPAGQVGRIFVGNEMLFEGYTSGASRETRDGLLDTGDLGQLDADGLLFVDGRADDMIVSGGENVFPSEVEDLLAQLPQVREVAVIGVPDPEYGQRLAAFLALHPGETLDPEAVREYVRHYLARFSVPRDVVFVKLPRNATGKVLTRELRRPPADAPRGPPCSRQRYHRACHTRSWSASRPLATRRFNAPVARTFNAPPPSPGHGASPPARSSALLGAARADAGRPARAFADPRPRWPAPPAAISGAMVGGGGAHRPRFLFQVVQRRQRPRRP